METKISRQFLIRGVTLDDVKQRYKQGKYNRPIPTKDRIIVEKESLLATNNPEKGIYAVGTKTMVNSNQAVHNIIIKKEDQSKPVKCHSCMCHQSGYHIGFIIKYEEVFENNVLNRYFYTIRNFCSNSCCLFALRKMDSLSYGNRKISVGESEGWLKYLNFLQTGSYDIKITPDPLLLEENGGTLTREEWQSEKVEYRQVRNIFIRPSRTEYERIEK